MSRVYVKTERVVNASPADVYEILSDYKEKRPQMLTTNFVDYTVEKGGRGNGTIVSYILNAARRRRPYRIQVDESIKGEVITERDANSSLVTTWSLLPVGGGAQTKVRVASEWEGAQGIKGFFEQTFAPLGLRTIYDNMLRMLAYQLNSHSDQPGITGLPRVSPRVLGIGGAAVGVTVGTIIVVSRLRKKARA